MPNFEDFAAWLFPGDRVDRATRTSNPAPTQMLPMLEEVSQCTQVPLPWLEKTAGLVVDGLAGLQCLWYLHGRCGTVDADIKTNWRYGTPENISSHLQQELINLVAKRMVDGGALKRKFGGDESKVMINWAKGQVLDMVHMPGEQDFRIVRTLKLGRWLRKQGASAELLHAFETRELPTWDWEISAHPYDVLTMSHERPWTSCMRPGGEYQYGPLTDMAAGSALIFFFRPGADKPCGRRILRPTASDGPVIYDGGRTYGCGPDLTESQLTEMLGSKVPVYWGESLCEAGTYGMALSRYIYSDTDHRECQQDNSQYNMAYATLDSLDWPEINLDFVTMAAMAEEFLGLADVELEEAEEEVDVSEVAVNVTYDITEGAALSDILNALSHPDSQLILDSMSNYLSGAPDYIFDDVYEAVLTLLKESLIQSMNWSTNVYAIGPKAPRRKIDQLIEENAGIEQDPELAWSTAVQTLELSPDDDWSDYFTADGQEVSSIVLISSAFEPYISADLWEHIPAWGEIDDYDWTYEMNQLLR